MIPVRHAPREARLLLACFVCGVMILTGSGSSFSEEIPQRLDGRVLSVDEGKRILLVDFEHPATGEHMKKQFIVGEDAGFKDFKKLSDLKTGDLVSLDYLEYKPIPKAIYIIRIPLEKIYFTHAEVAGALVKIKSADKNAEATKN